MIWDQSHPDAATMASGLLQVAMRVHRERDKMLDQLPELFPILERMDDHGELLDLALTGLGVPDEDDVYSRQPYRDIWQSHVESDRSAKDFIAAVRRMLDSF